ncbi:hypothetical protein KIPB_012409, partial [Kipferlia bialata]
YHRRHATVMQRRAAQVSCHGKGMVLQAEGEDDAAIRDVGHSNILHAVRQPTALSSIPLIRILPFTRHKDTPLVGRQVRVRPGTSTMGHLDPRFVHVLPLPNEVIIWWGDSVGVPDRKKSYRESVTSPSSSARERDREREWERERDRERALQDEIRSRIRAKAKEVAVLLTKYEV